MLRYNKLCPNFPKDLSMKFKHALMAISLSSFILGCSLFENDHLRIGKTTSKDDGHARQAQAQEYMITTQGAASSQAGKEMFELGGNIIDAAVAISFTISVERPQSTGIGGGGFLLHLEAGADKPKAYDFREVAPIKATRKMFLDENAETIPRKSVDGIFAAGVPGLVAGLIELHEKHGALPLQTVMAPAIKLAQEGFKIDSELAYALRRRGETLHKYEASRKIFFKNKGEILKEGDLLVQKDLAKTLRAISQNGKNGFYEGFVADAIIKESRRLGGILTYEDLKSYEVKQRDPVEGTFKDFKIFSMSPPSSGGIHIIQILNILEQDPLKSWGVQDPRTIHLTASAMQQAFVDRAVHLGDADFVDVPVEKLISKEYAAYLRRNMSLKYARRQNEVETFNEEKLKETLEMMSKESSETTHFTIMDKKGNVVSSTQTINGYFGSAVVVPGTGILLNNEMDDFSAKIGTSNIFGAIGSDKNLVEPKKRPLSSMSPTIVTLGSKPILALGSPSGTRILTCVAQTLLNYLEHELSLYDSITALRYHHQWSPDHIRIEEMSLPDKTMKELKRLGHQIHIQDLGCRVQAVSKVGEKLIGVSDPRGAGLALGK